MILAVAAAHAGTATPRSSGGTGYTTLSAAVAAAPSGDTIDLTGSFLNEPSLTVTDEVTIVGQGATIAFGGGAGITVDATGSLTLDGVSVVAPSRTAIFTSGTLVVTDSTLEGYGADGGALATDLGSVTLTGVTLRGAATDDGGGVYALGTFPIPELALTDVVFDHTSAHHGGGIGASSATLECTRCTFSGTTAQSGGAVWASGVTLTITDSTFDHPDAVSAGAIYSRSGQFTLHRSVVCAAGGEPAVDTDGGDVRTTAFVESEGTSLRVTSGASVINDLFLGGGTAVSVDVPSTTLIASGFADPANPTLEEGQAGSFFLADALVFDDVPVVGAITLGPSTLVGVDLDLRAWSADGDCTNDDYWPAPTSPLIDHGGAGFDLDGSPSDVGITGGLYAAPEAFDDLDADGVIAVKDCDDDDSTVGLPADLYPDADGDGHGAGDVVYACPGPWVAADAEDCDDLDPAVWELLVWAPDGDGDGYGDVYGGQVQCQPTPGWVSNTGDCDDGDPTDHQLVAGYRDGDGDGYGYALAQGCADDPAIAEVGGDCNDADGAVFPGALEACDDSDGNCNGMDDEPWETLYRDLDGDGYGETDEAVLTCDRPDDYSDRPGDCDDLDDAVNPAAEEVCNGVDDDCTNGVDDLPSTAWYEDLDGDGFGAPAVREGGGCPPAGAWVQNALDCDDANAERYDGAREVAGDGIDQDCDGRDNTPVPAGCAVGPGGGLAALVLAAALARRGRTIRRPRAAVPRSAGLPDRPPEPGGVGAAGRGGACPIAP